MSFVTHMVFGVSFLLGLFYWMKNKQTNNKTQTHRQVNLLQSLMQNEKEKYFFPLNTFIYLLWLIVLSMLQTALWLRAGPCEPGSHSPYLESPQPLTLQNRREQMLLAFLVAFW